MKALLRKLIVGALAGCVLAGSVYAGGSGPTVVEPFMTLTGQGLTGSSAKSTLDMTEVWNTSGSPTAVKLNVTDTTSSASSLLMDLRVGGVSRLAVDKSGNLTNGTGGSAVSPAFGYRPANANGIFFPADGSMSFSLTSAERMRINASAGIRLTSSWNFGWVPGTDLSAAADTIITRDAANTLAQRNGTSAQTFRLYNTYTDASNYERVMLGWSSNDAFLQTENAGTGVARPFYIGTLGSANLTFRSAGLSRWSVTSSGHFTANSDNAYDIGASGANRPRTIYVGTNGIFGQSVQVGTSSSINFASRTAMVSGADGNLALSVNAGGNFGLLQFGGATSSFPALKRSSAALQVRLADDSANAALEAKTVKTDGFTVATLPTCNAGAAGTRAYVTDATAPTYLAALVGGGAVVAPAFCNGTAWVSD